MRRRATICLYALRAVERTSNQKRNIPHQSRRRALLQRAPAQPLPPPGAPVCFALAPLRSENLDPSRNFASCRLALPRAALLFFGELYPYARRFSPAAPHSDDFVKAPVGVRLSSMASAGARARQLALRSPRGRNAAATLARAVGHASRSRKAR